MGISAQMWVWTAAAFAAGAGLGALVAVLWSGIRAQRQAESLKVRLAGLEVQCLDRETELRNMGQRWAEAREENEALKVRLARAEKDREADFEKLKWIEEAESHMRDAFAALAGRTLQTQSTEFLKRAGEQVEGLLNRVKGDWQSHKAELRTLVEPLRETLGTMSRQVQDLEQKREGAYQGLQEQLRQLAQAHTELQHTTVTLTQALRSPTVRGRWGELQLRRVVELAGMQRHIAFAEQTTTEFGRPDMIAHLPNGGILPVDSKVPLDAYLEAMEAPNEETRRRKLERYARAMQQRVQELGQRRYWEQFEHAPDFVVMFVPNEACLGAAFEQSPGLLEYAIEKRVLISTPVTLLALLRAVSYGWQQQQVTDNALQIAAQGKELYKRLEIFIGHVVELGRSLNKTVAEYNKATGSLNRRLLPAARRFEEMGVARTEVEEPAAVDAQAAVPESGDPPEGRGVRAEDGQTGDAE